MTKNRTAQLVLQSMYCALGLVFFFGSFGIYDDITTFRWDFYVHLTNNCNFLCIAIMFCELIQTIKKSEDSYVTFKPALKFTGLVAIIMTFFVFNFILAGQRDAQLNWRITSLLGHIFLPILFTLDWFLFYKRGNVTWKFPLLASIFVFVYIGALWIQAIALGFDSSILIPTTTTPLIYPYFFTNLETYGFWGVNLWTAMIAGAFIAVGFVLFIIDKQIAKKNA